MLSFSNIKDAVIQIGAPSTAVIVVILTVHMGWLPFDTELSRTKALASESIIQIEKQANLVNKIAEQHIAQLASHDKQLDVLIGALKEVCFNTAKTNERERACGSITNVVR